MASLVNEIDSRPSSSSVTKSNNHIYKPLSARSTTNDHQGGLSSTNQAQGRRNQRFMANIQATLLNGSAKPRSDRPRRGKQAAKEDLLFESITQVMDRIRLADADLTASLSDVRPYLIQNTSSFSEDELKELCSVFCESAIQQTNAYYIVGLCTDLIGITRFGEQMCDKLRQLIVDFLSDSQEDVEKCKALPDFLAQLAMARWPRGHTKAIENSNIILFLVVNTVMGWIQYISQKSDKEEDDQGERREADPLMLKCAQALCTFCMVGQRSIWLNFPDIFDGVYACTKNLLVCNLFMKRSLKISLLQLHTLLNKWSQSNVPKFNTTATQTI